MFTLWMLLLASTPIVLIGLFGIVWASAEAADTIRSSYLPRQS